MKPTSKNLIGLVVCGCAILMAPLVGWLATVAGLIRAFGDVALPTVDPSQKSAILAGGISHSMNWIFYGFVIGALAVIPTAIFAVRLYKDSKKDSAPQP